MDYVDLYLIHWPVRGKYVDTYRALEKLYEEGKVRAIGVSNFHKHHLELLLPNCKVKPMVNQVELHPMLTQFELRNYCQDEQIQMEAWSPLMRAEKYSSIQSFRLLLTNMKNTCTSYIKVGYSKRNCYNS